MATAIHHGAPGSYKSFTLIQRFAIPALIEGRTLVTNVRGFDDIERVKEAFPDKVFSDAARILFVDTTTETGRLYLACFYKWVPMGALIVMDEIQQIYPLRADFKLESLDKFQPAPEDVFDEKMISEGRPEDVFVAYDKQRHYNWDIYASTTHISKVKKEIRQVTEWAYRHRDVSSMLPWWKHTWIEHQHDPENTGKSAASRAGAPTRYTADPRIFSCYQSTATGEHSVTKVGRSIFSDVKVLFYIVVVTACIGWSAWIWSVDSSVSVSDKATKTPVSSDISVSVSTAAASSTYSDSRGSFVPSAPVRSSSVVVPFTPELVREWALHGITSDDFVNLPPLCDVYKKRIICSVLNNQPYTEPFLRAAVDKVCDPDLCKIIFFIKSVPDKEKEGFNNLVSASILH